MPAFLAPLAWNAARMGATWAARRWAQRAGQAVVQNALPATATIGGAAVVSQAMNGANDDADENLAAETAVTACSICGRNNPCAHLANGVPGSQYRGGAHSSMQLPWGDGLESHHTPARAASPLPPQVSPAIQMDPVDHALTASHGRMPGSASYRAAQARAIQTTGFMSAQAMDIADIRAKFGDKYDGAIAQMEAYTLCLRRNGVIR